MTHPITLPSATTLMAAPHRLLPRILHVQEGGQPRAYASATLLADAIVTGHVVIDDVVLPYRPAMDDALVDTILACEPDRIESAAHRTLKVFARLIALAQDPEVLLEPEAPATSERFPLRADLVAWTAYGVSQTFECGATDGRGIVAQLESGQVRVTVLPFAGLSMPAIQAYSFRRADNPRLPVFDEDDGRLAWAALMDRITCRNSPTWAG